MPVSAGDYIQGAFLQMLPKATTGGAATITKGDVLTVNASNQWITAPTAAGLGPFAVAAATPATTDSTVSAVVVGFVYVTADGTINPGALVTTNGTTTAGRVIAYTATAVATGTTPAAGDVVKARDEYRQTAGVYHGHENEGGQTTPGTAAAQGDVIRIHLRGTV